MGDNPPIEQTTVENPKRCCLILNPKWPWLGNNHDDIIHGQKTIEIKCPSKFRDLDIRECCHDEKKIHDLKKRRANF